MKPHDLLQEFNDFRRKIKAEIGSNEIAKSPQKQITKTQSSPQKINSSIKTKINLSKHRTQFQERCNTISSIQNQNQITQNLTQFQCITHEKIGNNLKIKSFGSSNKKKQNITDRILSYTQLNNFCFTLQQITDDEVKQLPNEYKQLLKQLAQYISDKVGVTEF